MLKGVGRVAGSGVTLLATLIALTGCTHPTVQTPELPTTHDAAWVDSAIAMVQSESDHDPVIRVKLDPKGATVITRKADTRVQRVWYVALTASAPQNQQTLSPTPSPTPTHSTPTPTSSGTESNTGHQASHSSASATPTEVATPLKKVEVDNSPGNINLGTFGDSKVTPMWKILAPKGCQSGGWTIDATGLWNGGVAVTGSCHGTQTTQINGQSIGVFSGKQDLLTNQLAAMGSITPNKVGRLTILRAPGTSCPIRLVADYTVVLGGDLHLRTTLTCTSVTSQTLSDGYLPGNVLAVSDVTAESVRSVVEQLTDRKHPVSALHLEVSQPAGADQIIFRPKAGHPEFTLAGVEIK